MDNDVQIKRHLANSEFNLLKARNIIRSIRSIDHSICVDIERVQKELNAVNRSIEIKVNK